MKKQITTCGNPRKRRLFPYWKETPEKLINNDFFQGLFSTLEKPEFFLGSKAHYININNSFSTPPLKGHPKRGECLRPPFGAAPPP